MTESRTVVGSFEEFRAGIYASLRDKVAERISAERENISNSLFAQSEKTEKSETQSNADGN